MITLLNRKDTFLIVNFDDSTSRYVMPKEKFEVTTEQFKSMHVKALIREGYLMILSMR